MAGESGLELVRGIAADAPETVVVMVTGVDDPEVAAEAVDLGVYGYLVKPFTTNEILIAVTGALRRRDLELDRVKLEEHQRELRILADRERIGRDLHDNVIQRLFATGLSLQGVQQLTADPTARERIAASIDEIDATIRTIRTVIFEVESQKAPSLRASMLDLTRATAQTLGFQPTVMFDGAVDTLVTGHVADQLLATLRESLMNVVRHASAQRVEIQLIVDRDISLTVCDDGVGIDWVDGVSTGGLGMSNLKARAERLGGRLTVARLPTGGTQLEWRVPLDRR